MRKKKKESAKLIFGKLILKVSDGVEIWGDPRQYMIKFRDNKGDIQHYRTEYLPDLEMCFREIFENILKNRLMNNKKKTCDEILRIVKETKKEIEKIWKDSDKNTLTLK